MSAFRLSKHQLALLFPAAFYFLWLGCTDWLNHFWTLSRLGSEPVARNYILFYLSHAAGIVAAAVLHSRMKRPAFLRWVPAVCAVLACVFTSLMAVCQWTLLFAVCMAAGLFAGFLPVLLSFNAYMFLPARGLGYTLGLSFGIGYLLHFILFVLAFPQQDGAWLLLKTALAALSILAAGIYTLFLPACGASPQDAIHQDGMAAQKAKHSAFFVLFSLLFIFSLVSSSQSHAATAVWLGENVPVLTFTRIFYVLGLIAGGVLCDRAGRYTVLSISFSLLAAGLLAMFTAYRGAWGIVLFSCTQLSAGLFSVFVWYTFIDMAKYFKAPQIVSSLSLALLYALRQTGYLSVYLLAIMTDGQTAAAVIFTGSLMLIAAAIPLISILFRHTGSLFAAAACQGQVLPVQNNAETAPAGDDVMTGIRPDRGGLGAGDTPQRKEFHLLKDFGELREAYGITERGMQVLELTLEGFSITQIAQSLGITERTVKYHTAQNFQKTNTSTYKQLFFLVIRELRQKERTEADRS
jgi:DNA-binding CsgD family transcriptional regulator